MAATSPLSRKLKRRSARRSVGTLSRGRFPTRGAAGLATGCFLSKPAAALLLRAAQVGRIEGAGVAWRPAADRRLMRDDGGAAVVQRPLRTGGLGAQDPPDLLLLQHLGGEEPRRQR